MRETVYIETTIFSFYHDQRTAPAIVTMRDWTREWWENCRPRYRVVTSTAVLAELETGKLPHKQNALNMALQLPAISVEDEVKEIATAYISHHLMPSDPIGDALHLAVASWHKCEYVLTWNCRHLANANKFGHIKRVNTMLGLYVPSMVTPLELMESGDPL